MIKKLKIVPRILFTFIALFVIGYLVIGEILLPSDKMKDSSSCIEFESDWYINIPGSEEFKAPKLPTTIDTGDAKEMIVYTVLPDWIEDGKALLFWGQHQDMTFYVDDAYRCEYSTANFRAWGKTSPAYYIFVDLNKEDAGKTLRIKIKCDGNYLGILRNVYYGDRLGIWMNTLKTDGRELVIGFLMICLSLVAIIISIVLKICFHKKVILEYLSWGILFASMWLFSNSVFRQIIFNNVSVIGDMSFMTVLALPIPFLMYMNEVQQEHYQKVYVVAEMLASLNFVVCTILHIFNIKDYIEIFPLIAMSLMMAVVIIFVTMIIDIFNKRVKSYLLIAYGLAMSATIAVIQVSLYILKAATFSVSISAVALAIVLIVAMINTARNVMQLEKDKQRAEFANESKAKFLANMSHEIRTPINAVLGMDEMILRESKEENTLEYAQNIQNAGKNLLAIINDILDISKIESGKMELSQNEYSVASLVNDTYQMVSMQAENKELQLVYDIDRDIPSMLIGDEVRVRQIMINLLSNAVKYTKQGTITMKMYLEESFPNSVMICISVKDTGIGIRKEDVDKLFDSFQRVDMVKNRSIEGTGLGLSITKQLVELMDGTIKVYSEYGKGSEFIVRIIQSVADERPIGKINPAKNNDVKKVSASHCDFVAPNARILAVDDVEMNLKVLCGLLKETQIQIDKALSGKECIELVKKNKYDIILLDHMMPEIDGIETYKIMQKDEDNLNKETPVIMLTANALSGVREEYLEIGFVDYLSKPVDINKLSEMIKLYLRDDLVTSELRETDDAKSGIERFTFLDTESGLNYHGASEELYEEMLTEFVNNNIFEEIQALYDKKDWDDYRIKVHALKGMALQLGANDLSQKAKLIESSVKAGDIQAALDNHDSLMNDGNVIVGKIKAKL